MFSVPCVFIHSKSPGRLLPVLSCVYLALYSQNACVCGCLCVCVCVRARALRIVSRDKILRLRILLLLLLLYLNGHSVFPMLARHNSMEDYERQKHKTVSITTSLQTPLHIIWEPNAKTAATTAITTDNDRVAGINYDNNAVTVCVFAGIFTL